MRLTCRMAWTMPVRGGSKVRNRSMGKESADEGKSMPMDAHLEGHERVLGQILDRILDQDDDNDEMHDGYQRRLVMVEGHTAEEADNACTVLAERVRRHYASKGRSFRELVVMRCERPPGRRRYEFGPAHARRIMEACGIQRTMLYTAMHELYRRESWTEPRLLFISDADAMAQAGRNVGEHCMKAGDFIRRLSDATRVRQVLFGSDGLRKIYETNTGFRYRTDAYHLDPEENRRRLRASAPGTSELSRRIASGSTLH